MSMLGGIMVVVLVEGKAAEEVGSRDVLPLRCQARAGVLSVAVKMQAGMGKAREEATSN